MRLLAAGARRPGQLVALVGLVMRTSSEEILLSPSSAGRALHQYFNERFLGVFPQNRLCRGVLLLPARHTDYLRGRRRQALRTNLRRAADAGIGCEWIVESSPALDAAREILDRRLAPSTEADLSALTHDWAALFARPEMTLAIARDAHGKPRALLAAVIDESVCVIHAAVASSHEARWALHDHLVRLLIDRGVSYLLSEGGGPFGALGFDPEVHHYQHLLGYELRHLSPRIAPAADAAPVHQPFNPLWRNHASSAVSAVTTVALDPRRPTGTSGRAQQATRAGGPESPEPPNPPDPRRGIRDAAGHPTGPATSISADTREARSTPTAVARPEASSRPVLDGNP